MWKALVDPKIIDRWGGGPSEMSSEIGFQFKLWDGDIYGENIEVVPQKKLVQEWISGDWPRPSVVTFNLKSQDNETILILEQLDIPDDDIADIDQGWDDYYLGPMKEMLEK